MANAAWLTCAMGYQLEGGAVDVDTVAIGAMNVIRGAACCSTNTTVYNAYKMATRLVMAVMAS